MSVRGFTASFDWDRTGSFGGPYDDVSGFVTADDIAIEVGRDTSAAASAIPASTLDMELDDRALLFAPAQSASPLYGKVEPGVPFAFALDLAGDTETLYSGVLADLDYDSTHRVMTAHVTDSWGAPSQQKLSTPVYTGMRTGDLIQVVLDAAGFPPDRRVVDAGATVVAYWWEEGTDAATAIQRLVDSEGPPAIAYMQGGVFFFRDRFHRITNAASLASQAMFTRLVPAGTAVLAQDGFGRTVGAGGFGTADSGQVWTPAGSPSDFSVSSGAGRITLSAVSSERVIALPVNTVDVDLAATFTTPVVATGGGINCHLLARRLDDSNRYHARLLFNSDGLLYVSLEKLAGGVLSGLGAVTSTGIAYAAGTGYRLQVQLSGSTVRVRAWPAAGAPPASWHVTATDTSPPAASGPYTAGVRAILSTTNTNTLPVTVTVDDVTVSPAADYKMATDSIKYSHGTAHIVNTAQFSVDVRQPGPLDAVWSLTSPLSVPAGQTVLIAVQSTDPFVGALTPVPTTSVDDMGTPDGDYLLAYGSLASVSLSRTSGQSALLTIVGGGTDALLTNLRVRANPLQVAQTAQVSAADVSSQLSRGVRTWPGDVPWCNPYDAQAIADRIVSVYATTRPVITFTIDGYISADYLRQFAVRAISDRITIRDDVLGINGDHMIEKVTRTVRRLGAGSSLLTIVAEPVAPTGTSNAFTFDVSGRGFDQGRFAASGLDDPVSLFRFDAAGVGFDQGLLGS